jgi:Flp pilus assembly protein TadG
MQQYDPRVREVMPANRLLAQILAALQGPRLAPVLVPARTQPRVRVKERGQAVVEFLIVIGVFILLIFGLTCVGQILLANYTVNQAARAAAHEAAIEGGEPESAKIAAQSAINAGVGMEYSNDSAAVEVTCRKPSTDPNVQGPKADVCRRYYPISVNITYKGAFWTPLPPLFTSFTVKADATRAAERDQQK